DAGLVAGVLRWDDFNDYYIKCAGKRVTIKLNGVTTVDEDFPQMPDEGIIAWQLHKGPAMEVIFKDIVFKDLRNGPGSLQADVERRAAEWVLSQGGNVIVRVKGQERKIAGGGTLPAEGFELEGIDLTNKPLIAADLERLKGLTNLRVLNLIGTGVGDEALAHVQGLVNLSELYLWTC